MKVSYNGLWKLLIDHEMKKMDLVEELGISTSTLAKMRQTELRFWWFGFLSDNREKVRRVDFGIRVCIEGSD